MKFLIPIIFFLFANHPEIGEIRKLYPSVAETKAAADAFLAKFSGVSDSDSDKLLQAYKGSAIALKGKFASKLRLKKDYLTAGAKLLEAAIKSEPSNVEMRMIRLSIQETLPIVVSYRHNIKDDREFIFSHYKGLEGDLKPYIRNFILQSESFSSEQKRAVK